jgi:hypothetical protein
VVAVADSDGLGKEGGVRAEETTLDHISRSVDLWLLCLGGKQGCKICAWFLEFFYGDVTSSGYSWSCH